MFEASPPRNVGKFWLPHTLVNSRYCLFHFSYGVDVQQYGITVLICISLMTKWGPFPFIYNTHLDILSYEVSD